MNTNTLIPPINYIDSNFLYISIILISYHFKLNNMMFITRILMNLINTVLRH
ncbi:hypothetical protein BACI9J_120120 [Bacillus altitudinis]|nr:hypothetical protein BACI9J_120120 [Bacillus altitudinis]